MLGIHARMPYAAIAGTALPMHILRRINTERAAIENRAYKVK